MRKEPIQGHYEMYLVGGENDGESVEFEYDRCEEGFIEITDLRFQETQLSCELTDEIADRIEDYLREL